MIESSRQKCCRLCNTIGGDRIALLDGSMLHHTCYNGLTTRIDEIDKYLKRLDSDIISTNKQILANTSLLRRMISIIKTPTLPKTQNDKELHRKLSGLKRERQDILERKLAFFTSLRQVFDVWPTYPPDWTERQELTRAAGGNACSSCGSTGSLDTHHLRPIREGGTHRVDNLVLLCRNCHQDAHGGRVLGYPDSASDQFNSTAIKKRIIKIRFAIDQHMPIRFQYTSFDGKKTNRTVQPYEIRKLRDEEITLLTGKVIERETALCMFGYCFFRNESRCFRVSRMRKIKVTD